MLADKIKQRLEAVGRVNNKERVKRQLASMRKRRLRRLRLRVKPVIIPRLARPRRARQQGERDAAFVIHMVHGAISNYTDYETAQRHFEHGFINQIKSAISVAER